MTTKRIALIALTVLSTAVVAACNSGQQASDQQTSSATTSAPSSTAPQEFRASVTLARTPAISTDGKSIVVTTAVANTGNAAFGTDIARGVNVNLGAHSVDASGKVLNQDLARASLPHIAPGASGTGTILLPIDKMLGNSAQILPVEEGVAWFDKWGTKPLTIGPFMACSSAAVGLVCDAADKPLDAATAAK
jgi:hypothetical protein